MNNRWLRDTIRNLEPYAVPVVRESIVINANESPYNIFDFPAVRAEFFSRLRSLASNRYPDPMAQELCAVLAAYAGAAPDQILAGNGGDEIIGLVLHTFVNPGDDVLIHSPTFDVYGIVAASLGANVCAVPDDHDFQRNADVFRKTVHAMQPKVTFICNPNNPTGHLWPLEDIAAIAAASDNPVVVDEAYVEFSGQDSAVSLLKKHDNLIIIRTLSKAFGLAGFRIGYAVAGKRVINALTLTKEAYNLNSVSQLMGIVAVGHSEEILRQTVPTVVANRTYLTAELNRLEGIRAYDSAANFILVKVPDGPAVTAALKRADICARVYGDGVLADCIRISVTTREVAELLIAVFSGGKHYA
ncbi:histidinol-phosphate transaminase [Megasphaera vaginalis (ex Bordigoni et al. 2020)]|uniref:histidinol-phosphate transaminase n=1 Tax=Megasphaera vaginalis (ex Bordigoni et al. 2020) TaxID=2045301 RepID=UPI000C7B97DC|nr:histidinol-phosphate transaminase [Megasphaera vaginalis (ex Bordigoni et al. 2020)]